MKKFRIVVDTNVYHSTLIEGKYIKQRAKRADKNKFLKALSKVADVEPKEYDK